MGPKNAEYVLIKIVRPIEELSWTSSHGKLRQARKATTTSDWRSEMLNQSFKTYVGGMMLATRFVDMVPNTINMETTTVITLLLNKWAIAWTGLEMPVTTANKDPVKSVIPYAKKIGKSIGPHVAYWINQV